MSFDDEEIVEEEEVVNETEEVVENEETEEVVREEPIKVIPKKKLQKNLLELLNDFRYSLYNLYNKEDKQLKILLLLYRKESLHVRKIEELTKKIGRAHV